MDLFRRHRRATWAACGAAGGLVLGLFGIAFAAGLYLHGLDLLRYDLGALCTLQGEMRAGRLDWVTPLLGNGSPLIRPGAQLLYPLRWLVLPLPRDLALSVGPALHLAIGAAGTTYLARTFHVRPFTAACAGIAFALSGTSLDLILHAQYASGAAWLPLAWACARRALQPRGGAGALLGTAASLALLLQAGEPQAAAIGGALVALEIVRRRPWAPGPGRRRALRVALVLPAAAATGLVIWLPILAEVALTGRAGAMSADDVLAWSFGPASWVGAILPSVLHQPVQPFSNLWKVLSGDAAAGLPWNRNPYLGPLLIGAAIAGTAVRRARPAAIVAGVGLLLSLGAAFPPNRILVEVVPLLGRFRYPSKYLVVTTLAAVVLAAVLLDRAARPRSRHRAFSVGAAAAGGVLLAGWLGVQLAAGSIDALAIATSGAARPELPSLSEVLAGALLHAAIPVVAAAAVLLAVPRARPWLGGLLALDLVFAAPAAVPLGPPLGDVVSPLAALRAGAQEAQPPVLCVDEEALRQGSYRWREGSLEWSTDLFRRMWLLPDLQACDGLSAAVLYSPLRPALVHALDGELRRKSGAAARALGCTHFVSSEPPAGVASSRLAVDAPGDEIGVFALAEPLPEAFVARGARLRPGPDEVLAAVLAAPDAASAGDVADDPLARLPAGSVLPAAGTASLVAVERPRPSRVRLGFAGSGGAVVGVRTTFHAGWTASQAGNPLPVVRLAGTVVGVVVPEVAAGPVELAYRPPRLAAGAALSGAGVLALGALALWARRRT